MRPPVENKFPWLGTFVTTENPSELVEFFTGVGHTPENANRFTFARRTFTFSEEEDGKFCQHTEFENFSKGISFPLGEKFTYPAFKRAPGVIVTQLYDWIPETNTMHSNVKTTDGFDFDMDFVFSEDFKSVVLVQRTGEIVVSQQLERSI